MFNVHNVTSARDVGGSEDRGSKSCSADWSRAGSDLHGRGSCCVMSPAEWSRTGNDLYVPLRDVHQVNTA